MGPGEKTTSEERQRRKETGDFHLGIRKQRHGKLEETEKKDRGRRTCVSLFVSGASTYETTQAEKGEIEKRQNK